jgi:DNA-binding MarR family transcriptional regulator
MARKRARPAENELAFETADRLHSAAIHLLRRLRRQDASTGLAAPRLSALSVIVFRGPITIGELAAAEQVRPPTITRLIAGLEEDGLVEREGDPSDRRIVRVRATAAGTRLLEEGRRRRIEELTSELARLSPSDLELLNKAVGLIEEIVGPRVWPARRGSR